MEPQCHIYTLLVLDKELFTSDQCHPLPLGSRAHILGCSMALGTSFLNSSIYLYFLQEPISLNLQVSGSSKIIFPSTLPSFMSHYFLPFLNCQTFSTFYPFPYWQVINEYSMISIPTIITTVLTTVTIVLCSVQFISAAQSCPTLCDPMNRSMPGLPVHHQLPEFTQTHVHQVGDTIQPSHPLSSPSPPAPNPSQHQGLFQ